MSPLTPEGAVVRELMLKQDINGDTIPLIMGLAVTTAILAVLFFIYYKGWRVDESLKSDQKEEVIKMNGLQIISFIGLIMLVVGVLFFKWNVGFTGFLIGSVLVIIGAGKDKDAIKSIPWGVIFMVLGVGVLMNIVTLTGGIDILVAAMQTIMSSGTAVGLMRIVAAIMSFLANPQWQKVLWQECKFDFQRAILF